MWGATLTLLFATWLRLASSKPGEIEIGKVHGAALEAAEERLLDILLPPSVVELESGRVSLLSENENENTNQTVNEHAHQSASSGNPTRQIFRKRLREGMLDDKEIEIELDDSAPQMEIMAPPGMGRND